MVKHALTHATFSVMSLTVSKIMMLFIGARIIRWVEWAAQKIVVFLLNSSLVERHELAFFQPQNMPLLVEYVTFAIAGFILGISYWFYAISNRSDYIAPITSSRTGADNIFSPNRGVRSE